MAMHLWRRARLQDDPKRFVVAFALISASLLAFYYFPRTNDDAIERWTGEYLRLYTQVVSWPIGLFDPLASAHGNLVAGRFSMQIVKSCDAMEANILFVSAILAVSAPWLRKAVALLVGLAALVAFNVLRLFTLYWAGVFIPFAFDFMHIDLWPLMMIAFAAIDFALCARWMRGGAADRPDGPGADAGTQGHAAQGAVAVDGVDAEGGEGHVAG